MRVGHGEGEPHEHPESHWRDRAACQGTCSADQRRRGPGGDHHECGRGEADALREGPVTRTTAREAHKRVAEWTAAGQLVVETASEQQSAKVEKSTEEAQKPVEGQNADRNCSPDEYEPSSNSSAVSLCTS